MPAMRQPVRLSFALPWPDRTRAAPVEHASLPLPNIIIIISRKARGRCARWAPAPPDWLQQFAGKLAAGAASAIALQYSSCRATKGRVATFLQLIGVPIPARRFYLPRNSAITSRSTSTATTTSSANILRSLNCATMNSYNSPAVFNFSSTSIW